MLNSGLVKVAAVPLLSLAITRRYGWSWPTALTVAAIAIAFLTYRDRQQLKGSARTSLKLNE